MLMKKLSILVAFMMVRSVDMGDIIMVMGECGKGSGKTIGKMGMESLKIKMES